MIFCRTNKVLRPPGMPFGRVLHAIAGDNPFVVHNRGLNFIFPIVGFLHGADLLDDDVRVPFHFSHLFRLSIFLLISFQLLPIDPVHISLTMDPSYIASMYMASIFKWAFHTLRPYFFLLF